MLRLVHFVRPRLATARARLTYAFHTADRLALLIVSVLNRVLEKTIDTYPYQPIIR